MKMEKNDNGSHDVNEVKEKRKSKLTVKAYEYKLECLQEERQAKVRKIKGEIREIKELMQSVENAAKIRMCLENITSLFNEATQLHNVFISMLPQEEKEKQNAWLDSVEEHKSGFVIEAYKWLLDVPDTLQPPTEWWPLLAFHVNPLFPLINHHVF